MEDLDRALALVAGMADPAMTTKNAAALRAIRIERKASALLLKEIHVETLEQDKRLRQLESQKAAVRESKKKFAEKESAFVDRERAITVSVRKASKVDEAAKAILDEREKAVEERETNVKRREKASLTRTANLDAMETNIRERGAALASAVGRAQALEV